MSSSINELYLIGNGFDMHHGIKSGYYNFKEWLEEKDPIVSNRLFQVYEFGGGDLWSSLEENLGNIPIEAILEDYVSSPFMIFFTRADGSRGFFNLDDYSDETVPEVGFSVKRLYFYLEQYFTEWILQLTEPNYNQRVQINKTNSYFINFNYTTTLETTYGINRNSVYYIHGCAALNQHLIFGHNQTPEAIKSKWHFDAAIAEEEQLEEAVSDMSTLYKDVNAIIKNSSEIWRKLSDVGTIHVWGLSLSDVDFPYLRHIKSIVMPQCKWEFSWYNENDKRHIENIIRQLSLRNTSLVQLSDIILPHPQQLNLFE